jgi:hypothetical protein
LYVCTGTLPFARMGDQWLDAYRTACLETSTPIISRMLLCESPISLSLAKLRSRRVGLNTDRKVGMTKLLSWPVLLGEIGKGGG